MVLTKLQVFGFKSFADKAEIAFDQGITAIVGPNGCGKSNVVDAIRWVFGEQKASALRSMSMQDVIFSGTQKRQPLNFAEVTLTIENSKGILPIEYSEVSITRRVYRSGESDYLLNRVPCRLRDVTTLFMDTGIGSNAYTTIENGMINAILSDKNEERRVLFEEAAGIGKYKQRRKESLRKLEYTRADLARINDKAHDKEQDVRVLARQVEKARRYRKWYDELRNLEIGFETKHYRELDENMSQRKNELDTLETSLETLKASIASADSRAEALSTEATSKESEVSGVGQEVNQETEKIVSLDKDISVCAETQRHLEDNIARFDEDHHALEAQVGEKSELRVGIEKGLVETESQLQVHQEELAGTEEELGRFDDALSEKKNRTDELATEQIRLINSTGDKKNLIGTLQTDLRNALDLGERSDKEIEALTVRNEENNEKLAECERQLLSACEHYNNFMSSREALVSRIESEDDRYRELLAQEKQLEAQIDSCKSQLEFLQGLSAQFEGYETGVKAILTRELPGRVGIVADLVSVADEKLITVVDRVLGQEIQTVVFETDSNMQEAIRFLTEEHVGSARLISLERLAATRSPSVAPTSDSAVRLREHVTTADEHAALADHLFNHVLIGQSTEQAMELSRTAPEGSVIATEDGVVCLPNGVVIAGNAREDSTGLLMRRKRIEALPSQIDALKEEYERVIHDKEMSLITRDEAKVALAEVNEKLSAGQRKQQEQETHIKHYQQQSETIADKLNDLRQERDRSNAHIGNLQTAIASAQDELQQLQDASEEHMRLVESAKADVAETEKNRHAITERVTGAQLRIQGDTHKIQQNRMDIERLTKDIGYLESRRQLLVENGEKTTANIGEIKEREAVLIEELGKCKERRNVLESRLAVVREEYNRMLQDAEETRKQTKERHTETEQLSARVFELRNDQTRTEEKMRALREKIFESYRVDLQSPPEDIEPVERTEEEVTESIQTYKERLNRLTGQVNMAAPEEYETKNKELQELVAQRDDLQTAVEDLEKAIRKLNREARAKFIETFELVRNNFTEMFTTLFEGGEVELSLEENVDPLEAAIRINVRPAGKKMRGVQLLSGGERALTAISLLFALYKVKPSAYCILDELDAPLDDANIGRFVRILREFSAQTQFIIITHNKRTMEAADVLYGVTHQEAGVSSIVSVRLDEAMRHAA